MFFLFLDLCSSVWLSECPTEQSFQIFLILGDGMAITVFISIFFLFILGYFLFSSSNYFSIRGLDLIKDFMVIRISIKFSNVEIVVKRFDFFQYFIFLSPVVCVFFSFFGNYAEFSNFYSLDSFQVGVEEFMILIPFQWGWYITIILLSDRWFGISVRGFDFKGGVYFYKNKVIEKMMGRIRKDFFVVEKFNRFGIIGSWATELEIPILNYSPVLLILYSEDVIHSLGCPGLGLKLDAIPGRVGLIGVNIFGCGGDCYEVFCTEFCGVNHSYMGFELVSLEELEFSLCLSASDGFYFRLIPRYSGLNKAKVKIIIKKRREAMKSKGGLDIKETNLAIQKARAEGKHYIPKKPKYAVFNLLDLDFLTEKEGGRSRFAWLDKINREGAPDRSKPGDAYAYQLKSVHPYMRKKGAAYNKKILGSCGSANLYKTMTKTYPYKRVEVDLCEKFRTTYRKVEFDEIYFNNNQIDYFDGKLWFLKFRPKVIWVFHRKRFKKWGEPNEFGKWSKPEIFYRRRLIRRLHLLRGFSSLVKESHFIKPKKGVLYGGFKNIFLWRKHSNREFLNLMATCGSDFSAYPYPRNRLWKGLTYKYYDVMLTSDTIRKHPDFSAWSFSRGAKIKCSIGTGCEYHDAGYFYKSSNWMRAKFNFFTTGVYWCFRKILKRKKTCVAGEYLLFKNMEFGCADGRFRRGFFSYKYNWENKLGTIEKVDKRVFLEEQWGFVKEKEMSKRDLVVKLFKEEDLESF